MNTNFWSGRRVLVTGASGFIGGHLVEHLVRAGAAVRAFVRYSTIGPDDRLAFLPTDVREAIEPVVGDITDAETVRNSAEDIDTIFHLAALIAIPYSYRAPESYIKVNVNGTLNVLTAARDRGARRVVHLSTSETYGTAQYVPMDERHPIVTQSPYAASKAGADLLAHSFFLSFGLPVVIARPFNTFGPRQSRRAVIPTIVSQALVDDEVALGSSGPTRDFNYVSDTVSGLSRLGESERVVGETVNIGSGREVSVADVVSMVGSILGKQLSIRIEDQRLRPEASEVKRLLCSNEKARTLMGWEPRVTLEQGLARMVEWFREHQPRVATRYEI